MINNLLIEKFQYAIESTMYKGGHFLIKLNISDTFGLHKCDVSFPLSQEHSLPISDEIVPYSLSKQALEKSLQKTLTSDNFKTPEEKYILPANKIRIITLPKLI